MIHVEEHTLGNRHLHSWADWVNFLERCFSLSLSSQAVDTSQCLPGATYSLSKPPPVLVSETGSALRFLNWARAKEEKRKEFREEQRAKEGFPRQDCFGSDCIITGDLSMEPGFARHGLKIIVSVMGSGRTEHQWRERDWNYIRDKVVGAMFISFPWGIVKETSLVSITTMSFT